MSEALLTIPDVVCLDDLDAFGRETTSDLQTLWQDVFHMLKEILGSNIDDVNRGIGVDQLLSGSTKPLATIAGRIDQGLAIDDRIDGSTTTVSVETDGSFRIAIEISVSGKTTGLSYSYEAAAGLRVTG